MSNFERIKAMDKSVQLSVYGYTRKAQAMFPSDNPYYNLSQLVTALILLYLMNLKDLKLMMKLSLITM